MDKTLSGVPHKIVYIVDILVAGIDQGDQDANLHTVFDHTTFFLVQIKWTHSNKYSLTYLAHRIESEVHIIPRENFVQYVMLTYHNMPKPWVHC